MRHGLLPLAELPQALPHYLGKRVDHENEDPRYYWLRHALIARPGCFEAIQALAVYLLPRWGVASIRSSCWSMARCAQPGTSVCVMRCAGWLSKAG